jgi:hypothetical protein
LPAAFFQSYLNGPNFRGERIYLHCNAVQEREGTKHPGTFPQNILWSDVDASQKTDGHLGYSGPE